MYTGGASRNFRRQLQIPPAARVESGERFLSRQAPSTTNFERYRPASICRCLTRAVWKQSILLCWAWTIASCRVPIQSPRSCGQLRLARACVRACVQRHSIHMYSTDDKRCRRRGRRSRHLAGYVTLHGINLLPTRFANSLTTIPRYKCYAHSSLQELKTPRTIEGLRCHTTDISATRAAIMAFLSAAPRL